MILVDDVAVDLIAVWKARADWGQQGYYTPNLGSVEPYQSSRRKMNFKVFKSLEKIEKGFHRSIDNGFAVISTKYAKIEEGDRFSVVGCSFILYFLFGKRHPPLLLVSFGWDTKNRLTENTLVSFG